MLGTSDHGAAARVWDRDVLMRILRKRMDSVEFESSDMIWDDKTLKSLMPYVIPKDVGLTFGYLMAEPTDGSTRELATVLYSIRIRVYHPPGSAATGEVYEEDQGCRRKRSCRRAGTVWACDLTAWPFRCITGGVSLFGSRSYWQLRRDGTEEYEQSGGWYGNVVKIVEDEWMNNLVGCLIFSALPMYRIARYLRIIVSSPRHASTATSAAARRMEQSICWRLLKIATVAVGGVAAGSHIANHGAYALSKNVLGVFDYVEDQEDDDTPHSADAQADADSQPGFRIGDLFGDYRLHVTLHLVNPDESYVVNARQKALGQLSDLHNFKSSHINPSSKDTSISVLAQKEVELVECYLKHHIHLLDLRAKEIETGVLVHGLNYNTDVALFGATSASAKQAASSMWPSIWPFSSKDQKASIKP
ncbi:hypothetical protein SeMB42_g00433 [Synchytrium endobioticum]|uniref:Uncharacterized protein n=1 Tax=Synchytrium endobioticum TaxID=286115 RepID=A0A507DSJ8_9FUNG|nr:hypothetical protein SeMB42_g00435 [Synchytrium endobioticum]TPX54207.1 hypothetical protein SeMB42_g00433 [Synchytrium endobioticum]